MSAYKEIVTKAVVGKGKKYYRNTYTINTDSKPNTCLLYTSYIVNEYYSVWMLLLLVFLMIFLLLYLSYTLLKNIKNVVIRNKYVRKGGNDENKKRS